MSKMKKNFLKIEYNEKNLLKLNKGITNNLMILILFFIPLITKEYQNIINQYHSSFITLTINNPGIKSVFYVKDNNKYCKNFYPPDEVYINGINQSSVNSIYTFNETKNMVKLVWKNKPPSTNCLFYNCSDINEIDLSHFESSSISGAIRGMFNGCQSLISLDLSNFNISQVTAIDNMFDN